MLEKMEDTHQGFNMFFSEQKHMVSKSRETDSAWKKAFKGLRKKPTKKCSSSRVGIVDDDVRVELLGADEELAHDRAVDDIEDADCVALRGDALDALDGGPEAVAGDLVARVLVAGPLLRRELDKQ